MRSIIGIVPSYKTNDNHVFEEYYKFIGNYSRKVKEANGIPVGILRVLTKFNTLFFF